MVDNDWDKKAKDALEHAESVYDHEVTRMEHAADSAGKGDDRTVKHVEREVELDAGLADEHIKHAEKVIEHQAGRVEKAEERVAKRVAEGKSEASIERAQKHADRVTESAENRVENVLEREGKHLERDAEAALHHIEKGADKIGVRDDKLDAEIDKAAGNVADAIDDAVKKTLD